MHAEARVDSYTVPLDAELAKAYLESYEIPVRLENEALAGSAFALGPIMGGIQLVVDEQDEQRARSLLEGYHQALHHRRADELDNPAGNDVRADADDAEVVDDTPDDMATRAWGSTLVAFVLLPGVMHLYSTGLLLRVPRRELSPTGRRRYIIAWVLNLAVFAAIAWLLARALR